MGTTRLIESESEEEEEGINEVENEDGFESDLEVVEDAGDDDDDDDDDENEKEEEDDDFGDEYDHEEVVVEEVDAVDDDEDTLVTGGTSKSIPFHSSSESYSSDNEEGEADDVFYDLPAYRLCCPYDLCSHCSSGTVRVIYSSSESEDDEDADVVETEGQTSKEENTLENDNVPPRKFTEEEELLEDLVSAVTEK